MTADDDRPFDPFDDPEVRSDFEPARAPASDRSAARPSRRESTAPESPARRGPRPPRARSHRPGDTGSTPAVPSTEARPPQPSVAPKRDDRHGAEGRHAEDDGFAEDDGYGETIPDDAAYDDGGYDDDDYVDLPAESRVPRWLAVLVIVLAVVGVAVGGTAWWYGRQVDPPGPPGARIQVEVPDGTSTSGIGSILADNGVVANGTLFNFYVGRKNVGPFQAGTYTFQEDSSFDEAISRLEAGPGEVIAAKTDKVTIPEGYTVAQIIDRIHEKVPRLTVADLKAALADGKVPSELKPDGVANYEGLLFPATYDVGSETTPVELLTEMAAEMDKRVNALDLNASIARIKSTWGVDVTGYDLLKVASMVQTEAAGEQDALKIGTVAYNRLRDGIALGYDSTSVYEAGLEGKPPSSVNYEADTPYNTRVNKGLPPTPIAAPGLYALEGALQPIEGPWLYFVVTDNKQVTFTVTYDDFLAAKALCRQRGLCG